MPKWIPCKDDYRVGDVVRWREAVWKPKARKNSKAVIIGERLITGQLVHCDGEWLEFMLKDCETTNAETWWKRIPPLKAGEALKRRRGPFDKRNPERQPWGGKDGESARAVVASRFLN